MGVISAILIASPGVASDAAAGVMGT